MQQAFFPPTRELGGQVISGATVTLIGTGARASIAIASTAILARLLSPAEFGLVAMATIVTELAALLANFGFGSILIQKRRVARIELDTFFWASVGSGLCLALLVAASAPLPARFFDEPDVGSLLRLMAWSFVFAEVTLIPNVVLTRLLQFGRQLTLQLIVVSFRATVTIVLAHAGFGIWSLALGTLSGAVVEAGLALAMSGYLPRLRFRMGVVASNFLTSGSYFGNGLLYFVNSNVDTVLVGRVLGAASLGIYQNARALTDEIRSRLAMPIQRVLFPAFSRVQDDRERMVEAVTRSGRLLATCVMPIALGTAAIAENLVPLLYGDPWRAMIPVLQILAVTAGLRAAASTAASLFTAMNRVNLALRLGILGTLLNVSAILIGGTFGLLGVAVATAAPAIFGLEMYRRGLNLMGLGGKELAHMLGPPFIIATLMVVTVTTCNKAVFVAAGFPIWGRLLGSVVIGAVVYLALIVAVAPKHVGDVRTVIAHFLGR